MIIRCTKIAFLVLMVISAFFYVGRQRLAGADEHREALVLYPSATEVSSGIRGGLDQLNYRVDAHFPAVSVIDWISKKLQKAGWERLPYDLLNPYSSQIQGWQEFLNGVKDPPSCVHEWIGDWKDASGNIVRYALRYEHQPCDRFNLGVTSNLTDLHVQAAYLPADVARRLRQAAEQDIKTPISK